MGKILKITDIVLFIRNPTGQHLQKVQLN